MLIEHTNNRITTAFERLIKHVKWAMPEGRSLPDDVWQPRHRGILALLWLHTLGIVCFGLLSGAGWQHSLVEGAIVAAIASAASWQKGTRKFRSAMASFGLITTSAQLVHLSGGYIEMHFHFFVMLAVIILYQDWFPFLLAIAYVFIHHGVVGVLTPSSVYNHPDAFAHPWKWAAIHGGFVLAASIAGIISWRLHEAMRAYSELILNSTGEGIIRLDLQGKITFMNPAAADMTGYRSEELKGQPLYDILCRGAAASAPSSDKKNDSENRFQPLTEGSLQSVHEGMFWRKDGSGFMAEYISTPIREAGVVVGTVVAFKDVTERQQAQAALQKAKEELEIRVAERTAELKEANERLRFELAERQRAEEALAKRAAELEESRNFLDSIIENIPTMLFTKDAKDLRFVRFNQVGQDIIGLDSADMIGKTDYDLFSKPEADFFTAKDREVLAAGKLVDIPEELIHTAHRGLRCLHTRKVPIFGVDGQAKYLLGISEDITERKQAEAALVDSEARYKAIANTVPGVIYQFTSRDGVWLVEYVAPQMLELFGLNAADVIQDLNNFIKHIYPDDLPSFMASVAEAVEKLTPWNYEGRLINPRTGELAWWQGMSTPVATTSGEIIFNGILLNITKRKRAEAALVDSEARYKAIATTMPGAIYQFISRDGVWTVDYMAPQTLELFGISAEEFMQDLNNFLKHIYPDDLPTLMASVAEAVEKLTPWNYEGRLINPRTGELTWWQGMSTPVATTSGEVVFNGILLNITKRKQAEAALALARDQALESSRLKTELLAKVSHELRTPLGAILGFAEMLELNMNGPGVTRQRHMTAEIIDSTHYLTSMVNELLDQAQLEAGRLELNIHPFVPAELLDDTLSKMSILAQAKDLRLTYDLAAHVPASLFGDTVRLQQILVNLISNAIKFTPTGGVQVRLYCPDAAHWALQVADTGSGIPVEAQAYIFEPFRQVDGSMTREYSGTGLGLSIVKQLTTLMGGEIILDSAPGQGSTFTVFLPIQPSQEKMA